jgi:hypothetical protein
MTATGANLMRDGHADFLVFVLALLTEVKVENLFSLLSLTT